MLSHSAKWLISSAFLKKLFETSKVFNNFNLAKFSIFLIKLLLRFKVSRFSKSSTFSISLIQF